VVVNRAFAQGGEGAIALAEAVAAACEKPNDFHLLTPEGTLSTRRPCRPGFCEKAIQLASWPPRKDIGHLGKRYITPSAIAVLGLGIWLVGVSEQGAARRAFRLEDSTGSV
jgi:hypothetical protein